MTLNRYELVTVSSGTQIDLATLIGNGKPRLFEGDGIYVFGLGGALYKSMDYTTFTKVYNGTVSAICQTYEDPQKTIIFVSIFVDFAAVNVAKYQAVQETTGGWSIAGALPSSFSVPDAVADAEQSAGILAGNARKGATFQKMVRSTQVSPYTFNRSDTGLPLNVITDLELL